MRNRVRIVVALVLAAVLCLTWASWPVHPVPPASCPLPAATSPLPSSPPDGRCTGPLPDRREIPAAPARYVDQQCAYDRETVRRTQDAAGAHGWRPFPDYDNANDWIALANLPDLPCNCPALPTFECAVWDRQIAHDLAPWINVSIPPDVLDQPFRSYERGPITYRLRINEWGGHIETKGERSGYHATFERMFADMQTRVKGDRKSVV